MRFFILSLFVVGCSARWFGGDKDSDSNSESAEVVDMNEGPMSFMIPDFIRNASPEAQKALFSIFKNQSLSVQQLESAVDTWATNYGYTQQVNDFVAQHEQMKAKFVTEITNLLNVLPSTFQQLQQIDTDKTQTPQQMQQRAEAVLSSIGRVNKQIVQFILVRTMVDLIKNGFGELASSPATPPQPTGFPEFPGFPGFPDNNNNNNNNNNGGPGNNGNNGDNTFPGILGFPGNQNQNGNQNGNNNNNNNGGFQPIQPSRQNNKNGFF